ncbi:MAG: 4-hydroxy-tetrahydrodipicolinate synthase [Candidatus Atribacteria bacterium]|nr:4-hydroxy-tetrahydrodipicolinate synthase [Candidatus Atribacteria bacterium]
MVNFEELKNNIKGVAVVMTTPFRKDYSLDEEGLKRLTRFLLDSGLQKGSGVLIPAGSTGECPMLTDEERKRIFEITKKETGDHIPVIGGCNHTDTRTVIKLVHYAEEAGLDGVMISPPYYWKPNEEVILTHYKAIAKETRMGIIVYNNWFSTQLDISVETMISLVNEIPNIIALKENTPYIGKFAKMVEAVGDKIAVLNGTGEAHEPYAALMGTQGFISGPACFIPKTCLALYQAEVQKDWVKAKDILRKIKPILEFISSGKHDASYLINIKTALNILGLPGGVPRLPLLPADEEKKEECRKALGKCGLLDK